MKINVNKVPVAGLHLEGKEDRDILEIQDELVRTLSPVRYTLDVGLSGDGLFATGSLEVDLEMECVRCLERFEYLLEVPDFAVQVELTSSDTVDLTPEIREDILLALPAHPHCDWNGVKACAGVRNVTIEGPVEPIPAESIRENPWTTLDKIKPKTDE